MRFTELFSTHATALLGAVICAWLIGAPALADNADGCVGDRFCNQRTRAKTLEKFDLEPAEAFAGRDEELVRFFFTDGYGRDLPVVEFRRRLDQRRLYIHAQTGRGVRIRSARLDMDPWRVVESARDAVRAAPAFQPRRPTVIENSDGSIEEVICGHAWTIAVETVFGGKVERRVRDTCDEDALIEHAFELAELGLSQSPPCEALRVADERPLWALRDCAYLYGREAEAASVMTRIHGPAYGSPHKSAQSEVAELFSEASAFSWPGRSGTQTGPDAARLWSDLHRTERLDTYYARIDGVSPGRVVVTGVAFVDRPRAKDSEHTQAFSADYEQVWIQEPDGVWRIQRWTVRPFRIVN